MENETDDTTEQVETEAPVVGSSTTEQTEESTSEKEIMIPKSRFDEVSQKLKELRNVKQTVEKPKEDVRDLIRQELAPIKVQVETESVIRKYPDFEQFATPALNEIKKNTTLTLEDAYLLAKIKSGNLQSKAKEEGKTEAYKNIEKKESLNFETSGPKKTVRPVEDLIRDKSVPLNEISKMLPRA